MAYIPPLNGGRINASISGNASGASLISSGTMILAGGNNVSLSQAGNTISINAGGGGGGIAIAGGGTTYTSGTVNLSANGVMSLSSNGQTLNMAVPGTSSFVATGGLNLATSGSTISLGVSIAPEQVGSYYDNLIQQVSPTAITYTSLANMSNRLLIQPLDPSNDFFPFNMTVQTMLMNFSNSGSSSISAAHSSTFYVGLYTRANSTLLNLVNSASVSFGLTANTANSLSYQGARWLSINSSQFSLTPAMSSNMRYYFGLLVRTSGANYASHSIGGMHYGQSVLRSGFMAAGSTTNGVLNAWHPFMGVHSITTYTAPPISIANSHISKASNYANFIPHIVFNAGGGQLY